MSDNMEIRAKLFMILSNILVSQCQELVVHKELINVIFMGVLSACMFCSHVCSAHGTREGVGTLEVELHSCELPFGFWDLFKNRCS